MSLLPAFATVCFISFAIAIIGIKRIYNAPPGMSDLSLLVAIAYILLGGTIFIINVSCFISYQLLHGQ